MRRVSLVVVGVVAAPLLVLGFVQFARLAHQYRVSHPEITLRDGTLLQVDGLTWGTNQILRLEPVWWTALKERLPPDWQARIGPPVGARQIRDDSAPYLWLSRFDPIKGSYLPVVCAGITSLDSAGHEFANDRWYSSSGRAASFVSFRTVDSRAETLQFRVSLGREVHDFSLPNPRHGDDFPVWTREPLPQSRRAGAFTFTLREFQGHPPGEADWQPPLTIAADGRDVSAWFNTEQMFSDPTGNRDRTRLPTGEPVWRLEITAYPSAHFPFPAASAMRLGKFTIPRPGKFLLIPPPPILMVTNAWLEWACLTGPGSFSFVNGENQLAYAPGEGSAGNSTIWGYSTWGWAADQPQPRLHLLLRGPVSHGTLLPGTTHEAARIVVRAMRADGTIFESYGRRICFASEGNMTQQLIGCEFAPEAQGGPLDLELFLAEPLRVDFTFASPRDGL